MSTANNMMAYILTANGDVEQAQSPKAFLAWANGRNTRLIETMHESDGVSYRVVTAFIGTFGVKRSEVFFTHSYIDGDLSVARNAGDAHTALENHRALTSLHDIPVDPLLESTFFAAAREIAKPGQVEGVA